MQIVVTVPISPIYNARNISGAVMMEATIEEFSGKRMLSKDAILDKQQISHS